MNRSSREKLKEAQAKLQARYRDQRAMWRAAHPDRGYEIDQRCQFLAPPELRVRVAGVDP